MNPKLKPIREQVVVLMGATSGIGLETAKLMAEQGARIAILGRSQEGLNDALDKVRTHMANIWSHEQTGNSMETGYGSTEFPAQTGSFAYSGSTTAPVVTLEEQVIAIEAEATNFDQVKSAADQVVQRFGHIDTWVNISGVSEWALFEDTSPNEFHRVIEVNLLGQSYGAMAALPYLKQRPAGALIFLSSMAGRVPIPYQAAYNASKQGIAALADTIRLELHYTGIPVSVTTILPSSMNTPLFEKARTKMGVEPHPVPPVYDVKLAAKAILFAAQHPVRELIVGDAGYMMNFISRLSPALASSIMGATSFSTQRTDQVKSAQAPDNLYQHIEGHDQTQGGFADETMRFSPITWLSTHPKARMAIFAGLLAGVGGLVGWRVMAERNRRRSWRYRLPKMANKYYQQTSKQALKASQQAWKQAQERLADVPVVSELPMFRKRSIFERSFDIFLGLWAALTSISLPFIHQRKSLPQRVVGRVSDISSNLSERIPDINLPWNRQPSMVERVTMAEQRKAAARRFNKMSDKMMSQMSDQMGDTRKKAAKVIDKAKDRAGDTSKQAQKSAKKTAKYLKEQMPSKGDVKDAMKKGQVVVRRQSLIEKLPFGERRETITEKLPINK